MRNSQINLDDKAFVDIMLGDIYDIVGKSQPALVYNKWYERIERRNCIERIRKNHEQAVALGLEWARIFNPSTFFSNWPQKSSMWGINLPSKLSSHPDFP